MRELNPSLFEPVPRPDWTEKKEIVSTPVPDERVLALEKKLAEFKLLLQERDKMEAARWVSLQQELQRLRSHGEGSRTELQEQVRSLQSRMVETERVEQKLEAMLDRHNQIVQEFELRLRALQKILGEREAQLLRTMAQLEDSRAELLRLKRS